MEEQNKDICSLYPNGCPECRHVRGRCILGDPQRNVYANRIADNFRKKQESQSGELKQ